MPEWGEPGDVGRVDRVALRGAEHPSTRRAYGRILRRIVTEFGSDAAPDIGPDPFADC